MKFFLTTFDQVAIMFYTSCLDLVIHLNKDEFYSNLGTEC